MLMFCSVSSVYFLQGRAKKKNASKTIILGSRKMAQCLNVLAALLDTQV